MNLNEQAIDAATNIKSAHELAAEYEDKLISAFRAGFISVLRQNHPSAKIAEEIIVSVSASRSKNDLYNLDYYNVSGSARWYAEDHEYVCSILEQVDHYYDVAEMIRDFANGKITFKTPNVEINICPDPNDQSQPRRLPASSLIQIGAALIEEKRRQK